MNIINSLFKTKRTYNFEKTVFQISESLQFKIYLSLGFMGTLGQIRSLCLTFNIFNAECLILPVPAKQCGHTNPGLKSNPWKMWVQSFNFYSRIRFRNIHRQCHEIIWDWPTYLASFNKPTTKWGLKVEQNKPKQAPTWPKQDLHMVPAKESRHSIVMDFQTIDSILKHWKP